ncbi:MAG: hypothetical protein U0P81_03335 [Holophagaceae bacterium]
MRVALPTSLAALLAVPALLSAQDPAPAASQTQRLRAADGEIQKLLAAMDFQAALARAEALLPASKPAFAKGTPKAGLDSSQEYSSLMASYGLAAKCAINAGEWEKGKGYLEKARDIARENSAESTTVITPLMDTWNKAMEGSRKALADGAARRQELEAKEKRTAEEQRELDNFKIHDNNLKNGPMVISSLQSNLDGLKTDATGFDGPIASLEEKLKTEAEDITSKFKGDKAAYVKAVMDPKSKNLSRIEKPSEKAAWLCRLLVLAPGNSQARKQLDILLGKAPAEPEKKKAARPKKKG